MAHTIGVLGHDGLVHPDTGVMIDVARFCQAHYGVDEDVGLALARSSNGKFPVRTVHRIPGLEGDDLAPSEFLEMSAQFGGGICLRGVVNSARKWSGTFVH